MTTGLWLGFRVGRATNKDDIRYSDFGMNGDTNVTGHFIGLEYVLMPRLTPFGEESFR